MNNIKTIQSYNGMPIVDSNSPNVVSPTPLNAYSTLSVTAYWRAINFLADNMACFARSVRQDKTRLEVSHPLDKLLRYRPNSYQNATQFWRTLYYHKSHCSNAYAEIKRTPTGKPESLHNLLPECVYPFRYDDGKHGIQQFYYFVTDKRVIPAADMIYLSGLSHDGHIGIDHLRLMGESFQRAKTLDRYMTRYLMKGTVLRGSIELPMGIEPEQQQKIVAHLRTYFQGADAERDVIVLSDGAHLNNATLSPQDSQLMEQAAYGTKQIAQITSVPPEFLFEFSETKYLNTIEAVGQNVIRFTFRPFIIQAEDELTVKLLTDAEMTAGYSIHLDTNDLIRGNVTTEATVVLAKVNGGLISRNEGRAELGIADDTDPESDKLRTLGSTTPTTPTATEPTLPTKASKEPSTAYAILQPIIDATIARIEERTTSAFSKNAGKEGQAKTIWSNVFAGQQSSYCHDLLSPIAATITEMGGITLPIDAICEKYAAQVRRKAIDGTATNLKSLLESPTKEPNVS